MTKKTTANIEICLKLKSCALHEIMYCLINTKRGHIFFSSRTGEGEVQCQHVKTEEKDASTLANSRPDTTPCVKVVDVLTGEIILPAYITLWIFLCHAL